MSTTTNSVVATAAIVTVGKWTNDEKMTPRVIVGGAFLAIGLALMEQANQRFAQRFAVLILVVAMFMYVPHIAYAAGLTNQKPVDWGGRITRTRRRSRSTGTVIT
jgi:hypothetical protein